MELMKVVVIGTCITVLLLAVVGLCMFFNQREPMLSVNAPVPKLGPVELPKAPHWDAERRSIYFVDVYQSTVHRYEPATQVHKIATVGTEPMAFVIPIKGSSDKFIVSYGSKLAIITWDGLSEKVDLKEWAPIGENVYRANEGKVSPFTGALFVGGHSPFKSDGKNLEIGQAALYAFYPNKTSKILLNNVTVANGMGWSKDGSKFFFIDSLAYTIESFSYNKQDDTLSDRTLLCDFRKAGIPGVPDGMAIDANDELWVTAFNGHQVVHIDPVSRSIIEKIELDSLKITSAVFAGKSLRDLYITSGNYQMSEEEKKKYPHAGYIYESKTFRVAGRPMVSFSM